MIRRSHYPNSIVFDLHDTLDEIFKEHGHLLVLLIVDSNDYTDFDNIVDCLIFESEVLLRLQLFSKELGDSLDFYHPFVFNKDKFESDLIDYGFKIYHEFKKHGLYLNGVLQYSLERWFHDFLIIKYTPRKMENHYGPIFVTV